MKKKNLIFTTLAFAVAIAACNKVDDSVLVSSKDSEQSESILSFEDENAFQAALVDIRRNGDNAPRIITRAGGSDFVSLYDEFDQAMTEADDYYQREGGYEEFKAKFPDLYYPEYKEDYSAFLPVSDEDVAKLLNRQGKVLIAGEERDFRDVWSYDKIVELGLGMPEASAEMIQTKAPTLPVNYFILTLDKQTVNKKRQAWITLRGINVREETFQAKIGRVDLCYRKKGALGWYNGKMSSYSYMFRNDIQYYYDGGPKNLEYSPHKYSVASRPINATSSNFGVQTYYFHCYADDTEYNFDAKFTTDVDALLDKNNGTGIGEDAVVFLQKGLLKFGIPFGS